MRRVYIMRGERLVEVQRQPAKPRVHILNREMPPTYHPAFKPGDPKAVFTDLTKFRQATKDAGLIEYGNDIPPDPEPVYTDWADVWDRVEQRLEYKNDPIIPGEVKGDD